MRDVIVSTSDRRIFFFSLFPTLFSIPIRRNARGADIARLSFCSNALIAGGCLDGHLVFFRGERISSTAIGFIQ